MSGVRPDDPPAYLPVGAIILSSIGWGLWWLPLRGLTGLGLSGDAANAGLYLVASLLLLPAAWRRRHRLRQGGLLLLGAGGLFGITMVTWNLALILGEVVRVTLLFYLAPVWATLLAIGLLGEPVGRLRVLSILLGLFGAGVLLGAGPGLPLPRSAGDWLGLAAGVTFALSVTLVRMGEHIDGRDQTLVAFAAAAVLSLGLVTPTLPEALPPSLGPALFWLALVALLWLLPMTWLLLWGARFLEPGRVALLLLLEVVVAAVSATLLAGEPFGVREASGCALILSGGALEGVAESTASRRRARP